MNVIKEYQIDVAVDSQGVDDAISSGSRLVIIHVLVKAVEKDSSKDHVLELQTCLYADKEHTQVLRNDQLETLEHINHGVAVYDNPSLKNGIKTLVKNVFESDLDEVYGAGNWKEIT